MDFKVVGYPKATVVTDDIFRYLVIEYPDGEGTVDVFRTVRGGGYEVHKSFGSHRAFREAMPNVARVTLQK